MTQEYLRVTPTSANLDPDTISTILSSLHKLSPSTSDGFGSRLNPFRSPQPLTFEFVAVSEGAGEPVEFFYGADGRLDVLQQRLQTIYPSSFDIARVEEDLVEKFLPTVENRPEKVRTRLEEGRLYDPAGIDSIIHREELVDADGGSISI